MIALGSGTIGALVVAGLIILVLLFMLRKMVNIVQQGEVGVVKRLGEYRKTHEPGLVIIAPFIDSLQRVDIREIPVPGDRQEVITRDNVVVTVNATIFTQIVDAKQALFSVANFGIAIDALARTALRSVIGTLSLDEALSERERINTDVQSQMEAVTDKWGIRIARIEIVEITPPPKILEALGVAEAGRPGEAGEDPPVRGQPAVGDQHRRWRGQGRHPRRRGRARLGDLACRGQPAGVHPRGRGTGRRPSPASTTRSAPPTRILR